MVGCPPLGLWLALQAALLAQGWLRGMVRIERVQAGSIGLKWNSGSLASALQRQGLSVKRLQAPRVWGLGEFAWLWAGSPWAAARCQSEQKSQQWQGRPQARQCRPTDPPR